MLATSFSQYMVRHSCCSIVLACLFALSGVHDFRYALSIAACFLCDMNIMACLLREREREIREREREITML